MSNLFEPPSRHDEPVGDLVAYAERAKAAARELRDAGEDWQLVFERGVREAFRQNDIEGLIAIVHYAVGKLDGEGRIVAALQEIDHVLALAGGNTDARCFMLALRAGYLVSKGESRRGLEAAREAEALLPATTSAFARTHAATACIAVRCRAFAPTSVEEIESLLGALRSAGDAIQFMALVTWYVPYLVAVGERRRASPWTRALRLQAELVDHRWREADAAAFALADIATAGPIEAPRPGQRVNWLARWRERAVSLRWALLLGRWDVAQIQLSGLVRITQRIRNMDLDPVGGYAAAVEAHERPDVAGIEVAPPGEVHITNLPTILAAAEAVGMAGTQVTAAAWLKWMSASLPGNVRTSIEWPVSRDRVEGLLAMRAGDHRRARRLFELAVQWTAAAGYRAEEGIARIQLGELLLHAGLSNRERVSLDLRREGWAILKDLGIDPTRFAYPVGQAIASSRSEMARPRLSPREAELLGLLAEGLTYEQCAQRMGVVRPTVQTLAHRIYEKLEASGRLRALAVARDLGIV